MPVKVETEGKIEYYSVAEKNHSDIYLFSSSEREIQVATPLELDPAFANKDFEVYLLTKKGVKESEIYQIYLRRSNRRIGWVFPASSIESELHDYAKDEHFLKYAYMGIRESLNALDDSVFSKIVPGDLSTCGLLDIFHEDTVLLVLSRETYEKDHPFNIDRAAPSLAKNGYVKLTERNPDDMHHMSESPKGSKLYIEEVAEDLDNHSFISELLNSSFPYESNPIFKFFYLYQIFELLIDTIYQNEQEHLVTELIASKGDTGKTKDALDNVQQFLSEKKRLKLLISEYTNSEGKLSNLRGLCNSLLNDCGRSNSEGFDGYFYKVRNFIFHQYRDLPSGSSNILNLVVDEIIAILPTILNKYENRKL